MDRFMLSVTKAGVTASELGVELKNRELFSALIDPMSAFIGEVTGGEGLSLEVGLHANRNDEVGIAVDRFLFRAFDLSKLSLDTFIELEIGTRVGENFASSMGGPASRGIMTGLEIDELGVPFGFRIETMDPEFQLPYVPRQPYLVNAWMTFCQLWLEDQLGLRFKDARQVVEKHIGSSLKAALPKVESGELDLAVVGQELEQRFRLSKDLVAALIQLPDWLADGGQERLDLLKKLDRQRKN